MNDKKKFSRMLVVAALVSILANVSWAQTATPAAMRLHALHAEPGKPSVYELALTAHEILTPSAEFIFEFPAEFDLAQLQIAGSPEMNGGFTLTRDKQTAFVKRSGLGQSIASGTLVRLRLGVIINPKDFASPGEVALHVRASSQSAATASTKQRVTFQRGETRE